MTLSTPLRSSLLASFVLLAGCKCAGPSLGPLEDPKPASLGDTGLLVEQPADGATIDAEWVTVTGWVDRSRYPFVAVVGAPNTSFYAATGHVGVPSVPVQVRADGRFVAARVPLEKGQTQLLVIGLTKDGTAGAQADRTVNTNSLGTPATIVVSPAEGGRAPLTVTFEPHTAKKAPNWQWDYDGDGRFDEEKPTGRHEYTQPGSYLAFARTRMDDRWVWAVAPVQVMGEDNITHSSTAVTAPRAIVVVPRTVPPDMTYKAPEVIAAADPMSFTRAVLVADGDVIKVFDPQLNLVRTLTGLKAPAGMAQDRLGRTYVADTGNDRVVRFDPNGALDPTFADGGVLAEAAEEALVAPTTLLLDEWTTEDGGTRYELTMNTARGSVPCNERFECYTPRTNGNGRFISTDSAFGGLGEANAWFLKDGKLTRDDGQARSKGDDVIDAARGLITRNPWWVVLRPDGVMEERFSTLNNLRVTRLGFPATAIAVDASADFVLTERTEGDVPNSRITGPHVIYVAGPGRLERRILPQMSEGLW